MPLPKIRTNYIQAFIRILKEDGAKEGENKRRGNQSSANDPMPVRVEHNRKLTELSQLFNGLKRRVITSVMNPILNRSFFKSHR